MTNGNEKILYKDLSYKLQGLFFDIRNDLGSGHKEAIYQKALEKELMRAEVRFVKEPPIKIYSQKGDFLGLYRPDFLVEDTIIIELKAIEYVSRQEIARVYDYLRNSKYELAYLVNFASPRLFMKRVIFTKDKKDNTRIAANIKQMATNLVILFVAISLLFVGIRGVRAAEIGLGVTKDTFDLQILPGDKYEGKLSVFNKSAEGIALPVHIELVLWNLKEDSPASPQGGEDIEFVQAEPALNATKWFTFEDKRDFILDPERSRQVKFQITPPNDVVPGAHFVMMRLQPVIPAHYFEKEGLRFIPEVGVLFFIKIPSLTLEGGQGLYGARILAFETKGAKSVPLLSRIIPEAEASVFEDIVKTFSTKIRNTGLYHFKASGFVEIRNLFGMVVAKQDLPARYLLPSRSRSFDIPVISQKESFFKRNSYAGPYRATLALYIPESDTPVVMEERFWVFPWKQLSLLLFLLLFLLTMRKRIIGAVRALARRSNES